MKFDPLCPEVLNHAVSLVVSACETAFADSLQCVTLKGSAVKGDFIKGYSDFDFHVFLRPEAMDAERAPRVEAALRFQKAFGEVDPEYYGASQFQIYFISSESYPSDWLPPVKGTYKVCWGKPSSRCQRRRRLHLCPLCEGVSFRCQSGPAETG